MIGGKKKEAFSASGLWHLFERILCLQGWTFLFETWASERPSRRT